MPGQERCITSATAVNGTLTPVNDRNGIEEKAFDSMIRHFSTKTLMEFYRNMFDDAGELDQFLLNKPQRTENDILHELVHIRKYYGDLGSAGNIFRRILVGSRDRIFPARNQIRSWGRENCSILKAPHFPFYGWTSWDALINEATTTS